MIFSKSQTVIKAEPALSLYGNLLSYYPHIKFLGITFDNRMTFTKHFEEILERCNHKFHRLRYWSTKSGVKSHSHVTNLQTMGKTNIRIWDCFYQTVSRVVTNLENMENLENSGILKNCQNLREI